VVDDKEHILYTLRNEMSKKILSSRGDKSENIGARVMNFDVVDDMEHKFEVDT
jgi:hypothetical protein